VIWVYKHKHAYSRLGISPPKGILLYVKCIKPFELPDFSLFWCSISRYGPPGTGKTLLAKAVASESQANFLNVNISDIVSSEIGTSEKFLAEMFQKAKLYSPSVLFIDEIQAVFGQRELDSSSGQKVCIFATRIDTKRW
jgi:transitional endoplasmic reticulum ATPase